MGELMAERCYACGNRLQEGDAAQALDYYTGVWCHDTCLNSPQGIAWREHKRKSDPGFDRFWRLQAVGLRTTCPSCGKDCLIAAKARGMAAGDWQTCCSRCSNITTLNGYVYSQDYEALMAAEKEFLRDGKSTGWQIQVENLALTVDRKLTERRCSCGGRFSVAAKPRCPHCHEVLLDSCFHFACLGKGM
jgi:hypothetical protein